MKNIEIQKKARTLIPGGTQLLSKRPEMFAPEQWPGYYQKAKGAYVWDIEGKQYLDMSIGGIGANVLGYADPDVNEAVVHAIENGSSTSLNPPEEVELAEKLCSIHPWAQMVRYARTGGESMAIAVRIARAASGRDKVAFCGYHGWHDWYLATNLKSDVADHLLPGLSPAGVPSGLANTSFPFHYNNIEELESIIANNKGQIGVIVMEPMRDHKPTNEFLQKVRVIADREKIVLVFDEITAGFRMCVGGVHKTLLVEPDIAVFGKALSNGFPMGAIIGKRSVMEAAQSTFISSTYWTERIGPVAALATINKFEKQNAHNHLNQLGETVQKGWMLAAKKYDLSILVEGDIPPLSHFAFRYDNAREMMTLFVQLMLEKGILSSNRFYAMFAHTQENCSRYLDEVDRVFKIISEAQQKSNVKSMLKGPVAHSGFQRLT